MTAEPIYFYAAAARRGHPVPPTGRLLALSALLENDEKARTLIGQPIWRGPRSAERNAALAALMERWERRELGDHPLADHLAALIDLQLGAATEDALGAISWLAEENLREHPALLPAGAAGPHRLRFDPTKLGLAKGSGIELTVLVPPPPSRLPVLHTILNRGTGEVEAPHFTPPATGYAAVLVLRSPGPRAYILPARTRSDYAMILSLNVYGLPDFEQSKLPDPIRANERLQARNRAVLNLLYQPDQAADQAFFS